jgi:hypothetical protein
MGTRSLTFVHEDDGPAIVCVYQQYDGYFDGVGDDILTFLKGKTIVNGFGGGDTAAQFNGAGDLAARLITHFKDGDENRIGNVYLYSPDRPDDEEYSYHIHCTVGQAPRLVATDVYAKFTVDAPVDEFVWPQRDDDGNYAPAAPPFDPDAPVKEDQRRALFATFGEVFGDTDQAKRIAFTRMVLGTPASADLSWSPTKPGYLTVAQASRVLDALNVLNV